MKTIFIDYPQEMTFRTKKNFQNLDDRTEYLRKVLKRKEYNSFHHPDDFVVELVENKNEYFEVWIIGS